MDRQDSYLVSIRAAYPSLEITSGELNTKGQNNDVLIINNNLIFRFPKYLQVIDQLKMETAILAGIKEYITLDVPVPKYINLEEMAVGEAFVGYPLIQGEPLWRDTYQTIRDERIVEVLATQLACFLKELHNIPYHEALAIDLPVSDTYEECVDIYTRIRNKLFTYMRLDARAWAADHFETFFSKTSNFEYEPVLKHGDFGPSNILYDKEAQAIVGIIDFSGSGIGDPAYDFAGLLSGYGESFVRRCIKTYPEVESFLDRSIFYQGTFALLEALFGIENEDEEAFRDGIEKYV
jgi:aminoglycoside 2''-phosphotransferase